MKNRRRTFGFTALAVVLAAAIGWYQFSPGEAPPGQSPLVTLDSTSLQGLRADFNRELTHTRIIVLLSPT